MMISKTTLQRALKVRHIVAAAVGGTISSTYFLGNGYLLNQLGPFAFLAFALGGLITFLTMSCMAELAANEDPTHHSFISYAKRHISSSFACGVGWSYWMNWVLYIPTECISGGILMKAFIPDVPVYVWATLFGLMITYVNVLHVRWFAKTSFWLTFIHVGLFATFSFLAVLIFFGVSPNNHEFIGTKYLLSDGFFPNGVTVFLSNMVILLLNYQGGEIIGLAASEAHEPKKVIPKAMREIGVSISIVYSIPMLLLGLIYPWKQANVFSGSVFADALSHNGFVLISKLFIFLIITGVLSCANSGLYAAARVMHSLSTFQMSPKFLTKLNRHGVPAHATLITWIVIWGVLFVAYFFPSDLVYKNFLALSGFTGQIAWIAICWAQYRFRKNHNHPHTLKYKIAGFPFFTLFAIWVQVICLLAIILSPDLRPSFYIGFPALLTPIFLYKWYHSRK